jgi:predicted TIM-barrel fold metal-dependent hydrolase
MIVPRRGALLARDWMVFAAMSRVTLISSDGHVAARMADHRPYLESAYLEDFDAFLIEYSKHGVATFDAANVADRLDPEVAADWQKNVTEQGRLDAAWNPERRLAEMDREGIAAEVLFQEFATPFMMTSPTRAAAAGLAPPTLDQLSAGYRAYNRWLADFRASAPERWIGMAAISFHDVDAALAEIKTVKELGFGGVAIPALTDDDRLYRPHFDKIWAAMEELELVANIHVAIANTIPQHKGAPSLTASRAMIGYDIFIGARNLLPAFIFGGILERFPRLKVAFTETHSDWVLGTLKRMDHAYERSDLRRDIRDTVPMRPSEYWQRQCYLGSSIWSRAEIAARHRIGVDKMMIGIDFPHMEGAWRFGTDNYIKATFGTERVPADEARQMFSENAAAVYGFDLEALNLVSDKIGWDEDHVLTAPEVQPSYRGDLDRPLIPS